MIDQAQRIRDVLSDRLPVDCDDAIQEYLQQVLEDVDDEVWDDEKKLRTTLEYLLEDDDLSQSIAAELMGLKIASLKTE